MYQLDGACHQKLHTPFVYQRFVTPARATRDALFVAPVTQRCQADTTVAVCLGQIASNNETFNSDTIISPTLLLNHQSSK